MKLCPKPCKRNNSN